MIVALLVDSACGDHVARLALADLIEESSGPNLVAYVLRQSATVVRLTTSGWWISGQYHQIPFSAR